MKEDRQGGLSCAINQLLIAFNKRSATQQIIKNLFDDLSILK